MTLWCVKGGRSGEREQRMLDKGIIGIGWEELGNLSDVKTREGLTELYRKAYPNANEGRIANHVGQLWAFLNRMSNGNFVVVPLKTQPLVAIGRILSNYTYREDLGSDFKHTRTVQWLKQDLPRNKIAQDLLYSLGAFMTVCQISRNDAEERFLALIGEKPTKPITPPTHSEDESIEGKEDLERVAHDQIIEHIGRIFKGHKLAELVKAILDSEGYITYFSPPGVDGGADILAGSGSLGFGSPKICVQVKSGNEQIGESTVRELQGVMRNFNAEQGLLVSWTGFKRTTLKESAKAFFNVRFWDSENLVKAILRNYNHLPENIKAELPLKQIWTLVPEEEE